MSARFILVIASATVALAPIQALAKGQPTPTHAIAAVSLVVPHVLPTELPNVSADKLLKGCGTHRYREPTTQQCRSF
jgi:hypothetical protein